MNHICNDTIFGEMIYKHRWVKQHKFFLWGKEWDITVAAKAYSEKPITEEQRKSYSLFMNTEESMKQIITKQLCDYMSINSNEINMDVAKDEKDLAEVLRPKTLLFKQNGDIILLLDCVWDTEHGMAVQLIPEVAVGIQDLFL